ncbi:MAG TPA: hypothetical protein PLL64_01340 [Rhodothermales bacterium]|nr:hypothetical protein [Rhodothermales bacterium]HRR09708.1 hypothetical protein [Rhodothermales bacterium]
MTNNPKTAHRKVVDWNATFWSGLVAGIFFYCLNLLLTPLLIGANEWAMVRLLASPFLGEQILAPPATLNWGALSVSVIGTLLLSLIFTSLISVVVHKGGLLSGILLGAVLGLALYAINFYTLTYFFPWFFAMRSGVMVFVHMVFGAVAGGLYEALEVEVFEEIEEKIA